MKIILTLYLNCYKTWLGFSKCTLLFIWDSLFHNKRNLWNTKTWYWRYCSFIFGSEVSFLNYLPLFKWKYFILINDGIKTFIVTITTRELYSLFLIGLFFQLFCLPKPGVGNLRPQDNCILPARWFINVSSESL